MKNKFFYPSLVLIIFSLQSFIITRDDVADSNYIVAGKKYSDVIVHFPNGEGTLINSSWVITAGHVGQSIFINPVTPVATINGRKYEIKEVIVHPDFKPLENGLLNDVALIKLKSKVDSQRFAEINNDTNETGKPITLVGMGDVGTGLTGPQKMDKTLRAATNRVDGVNQNWIWFAFDTPTSKNTTALEGISGPGDSGGPAFIERDGKLFIAGISSNQKSEGHEKGTYGVVEYYTRISRYASWINSAMKDNTAKKPVKAEANIPSFDRLKEFTGIYGFRKIIYRDGNLFFQRENEPLIPMKQIDKDLFLWDDNSTKIMFERDEKQNIVGFEIRRMNGEVVPVKRTAD